MRVGSNRFKVFTERQEEIGKCVAFRPHESCLHSLQDMIVKEIFSWSLGSFRKAGNVIADVANLHLNFGIFPLVGMHLKFTLSLDQFVD